MYQTPEEIRDENRRLKRAHETSLSQLNEAQKELKELMRQYSRRLPRDYEAVVRENDHLRARVGELEYLLKKRSELNEEFCWKI